MTLRQKTLAKDLLENAGKPVSQAMLDAGYKPGYAKNPQELTNTKGWQELMEQYFPDEDLGRIGQEGLQAMRIHGTNDNFIEIPDHATRHKFWDTALKLKGRLKDTGNNLGNIVFNVKIITDEQQRTIPIEGT